MKMVLALYGLSVLYYFTEGISEGYTAIANDHDEIPNDRYHTVRMVHNIAFVQLLMVAYFGATASWGWSTALAISTVVSLTPIYDRMIQLTQGRDIWVSPYPWMISLTMFRDGLVLVFKSPSWEPWLMVVGPGTIAAYYLVGL